MAFTAGSKHAKSNDLPYLSVTLNNHEHGTARFPNRPGDDQQRNKGDFWTFDLRRNLGFKKGCITKADIKSIVVQNGGKDGWRIESIITILRFGQSDYSIVTADIGTNKAVDRNPSKGDRSSFREITLNKTYNY